MWRILKKIWPIFIGLAVYIAMSAYLQSNMEYIRPYLQDNIHVYGMALYVLLGIITVSLPFTSLIPFIPVAVSLWGWQITALLTLIAWVIGGQIVFEVSRRLGRGFVGRFVQPSYLEQIRKIVSDKGIIHSILVRMVVHADIVSIGFGVFTHVGSAEFLLVTAIGVAPSAILYAYFGSLTFVRQITIAGIALSLLILYWIVDWRWPRVTKALRFNLPV